MAELRNFLPATGGDPIVGTMAVVPDILRIPDMLPTDGNYFSPTDFPTLAALYPNNLLPTVAGTHIVTGVSGEATLVSEGVNISFAPFKKVELPTNLNSAGTVPYCIATDRKGVWMVGFDSGYASRSLDNGLTWTSMGQGLNMGGFARISVISTNEDGTWIAAGNTLGYASRSTDNGETWSPLPRNLGLDGVAGEYVSSVYGTKSGTWLAIGNKATTSRSTDDGLTWSRVTGMNGSNGAVIVGDGKGTWLRGGISSEVIRSTNDGVSGSALPRGLNSGNTTQTVRSIATDRKGVWIVGFSYGYAARTTDNGVTWSKVTVGIGVANIVISTDRKGTWVAIGNGQVTRVSFDNGATWATIADELVNNNSQTIVESDGDKSWIAMGNSEKPVRFTLEQTNFAASEYRLT